MDTGPVFGVMTEPVRPRDTSGDLLDRLATAGAGLLVATLDALERGEVVAVPQPPDGVVLRAQARRRGRPRRLGPPGVPRRPAGPRLHARPGRLDHVAGRTGRPGAGRAGRAGRPGRGAGPCRPARRGRRLRRRARRAAGRGASRRPTADGGRRVGAGSARPRRSGAGPVTAAPGPAARHPQAAPRPAPRPTCRAGWRSTSSAPSTSATPTPTSCSRGCCGSTASRDATPRSRPSWPTARCAAEGRTTPCWAPASTARWTGSTPRCSTCCDWAPTSCSRCGCPGTQRSPRRSSWPGRWWGRAAGPSSTPCCGASAGATWTTGSARSRHHSTPTPSATWRSPTRTRAGSCRRCGTPSGATSTRPPSCWPPTTGPRRSPWSPGPVAWACRSCWPRAPGRAPGRRTPRSSTAGTPPTSPRCATGGPGCRTRAASSSRSRSRRRR